ncbi:DUF397 domain-containing protein [Patescibacteria group bacterium]|nr:DUF397 domain-containing protein [Patescibacteria group bacterium]
MNTMIKDGAFRKSSLSRKPGLHCVEVAHRDDDTIVVRNSKIPGDNKLHFNRREWDAFIRGVKVGEFDI